LENWVTLHHSLLEFKGRASSIMGHMTLIMCSMHIYLSKIKNNNPISQFKSMFIKHVLQRTTVPWPHKFQHYWWKSHSIPDDTMLVHLQILLRSGTMGIAECQEHAKLTSLLLLSFADSLQQVIGTEIHCLKRRCNKW
jgi:hypothetical protein